MSSAAQPLGSIKARLAYAGRQFHAWWEGYAFDAEAERAAIAVEFPGATGMGSRPPEEIVAEAIWGEGRLEPGSPAWTLRFARSLSLPVKANVVVFGAGGGAPLTDLKHGTRWKLTGYTRNELCAVKDLHPYTNAQQRLNKASAAGAISLFELHRDAEPSGAARIVADFLTPGAKASFVDYNVIRKGVRLRGCFPGARIGGPRPITDYQAALGGAGFRVTDCADETAEMMDLVARGWAGWRRAYAGIANVENARIRASLTRALSAHARLWADRFDAMKSGHLQVTRFTAIRD